MYKCSDTFICDLLPVKLNLEGRNKSEKQQIRSKISRGDVVVPS